MKRQAKSLGIQLLSCDWCYFEILRWFYHVLSTKKNCLEGSKKFKYFMETTKMDV
jgi:hypothetical protein